jgi:polyphosphate glucokinase
VKKRILVIDVGGSNVKLMISRRGKRRKFGSGRSLTPGRFVAATRKEIGDWKYDVIAIGFPAPVRLGKIIDEPKNLGKGWVRFNFRKALGKPVRIINDAAMQALGSYDGGRMLFLGLGTGLGSALLWDRYVVSLELGELPYTNRNTIEDQLGDVGLERLGFKNWQRLVKRVIPKLKKALIADYVVLGGGNAKLVNKLPPAVTIGHNRNAFNGGQRLWQQDPRTRQPHWNIL